MAGKFHFARGLTGCESADLKASFGDRRHELSVNTYQMCVLMLFNDVDRLSYREIQEVTNIPDAELKRSLQSLACAKVLLLGGPLEQGTRLS